MWPFGKKPVYDAEKTNIGNVLREMGLITQEQLLAALMQQDRMKGKLGAILVSNGVITESELESGLGVQKKLRTGREAEANLTIAQCRLDDKRAINKELRSITIELEAASS